MTEMVLNINLNSPSLCPPQRKPLLLLLYCFPHLEKFSVHEKIPIFKCKLDYGILPAVVTF